MDRNQLLEEMNRWRRQAEPGWRRKDYWRFWIAETVVSALTYGYSISSYVDDMGNYNGPPSKFIVGVAWTAMSYGVYRYIDNRRLESIQFAEKEANRIAEKIPDFPRVIVRL